MTPKREFEPIPGASCNSTGRSHRRIGYQRRRTSQATLPNSYEVAYAKAGWCLTRCVRDHALMHRFCCVRRHLDHSGVVALRGATKEGDLRLSRLKLRGSPSLLRVEVATRVSVVRF